MVQLAALVLKEIIRSDKPDATIWRPAHSKNKIVPRSSQQIDAALRVDLRETSWRENEDRAAGVRRHVEDVRGGQTVLGSKTLKDAPRLAHQTISSADPHATALEFARAVVAHACLVCDWDQSLAASAQGVPPPVS